MKWFPSWDLTVMKLLTLAVLSQEYPGKNNSKVNTMAADGLAPRAARSSPATIWVAELILGRGIAGFTRISHVWRKIEIIMRQRIRIFLLFGAISMLACVKYKYFHDFFVTLLAIETVDRLA